MSSGMRIAGVLLALAVGLLVAGCGGGSSPEDTVEDYVAAAEDQDAEAACELLSSSSIEALEATGSTCEETFEQFGGDEDVPEDLEIGEATEDGDTATVETTGDGETTEIPLVKEDDEWKIDFTALAPTEPSGG